MTTIEQLLEQHDHYDLGDGFTIGKRACGWIVYYRSVSVSERLDLESISEASQSYPSAVAAVRFACWLKCDEKAMSLLRESAKGGDK